MTTNHLYNFDGLSIKAKLHQGENNKPYGHDYALVHISNSGFKPGPNVITTPMLKEFTEVLKWLSQQKVEYAVFRWNGETTGYGVSIDEFLERMKAPTGFKRWWAEHLDRAVEIFNLAEGLPMHTMSILHGTRSDYRREPTASGYVDVFDGYRVAVVGGSLELPLLFNEVVMGENTRVGYSEVTLGVVPGLCGVVSTTLKAGKRNAQLLVESGGSIDGELAKKIGLADQVVPEHDIQNAIYARIKSGERPQHKIPGYLLRREEIDVKQRNFPPVQSALERVPEMMDGVASALGAEDLERALKINRDVCYELGLSPEFRERVLTFVREREIGRAKRGMEELETEVRGAWFVHDWQKS